MRAVVGKLRRNALFRDGFHDKVEASLALTHSFTWSLNSLLDTHNLTFSSNDQRSFEPAAITFALYESVRRSDSSNKLSDE